MTPTCTILPGDCRETLKTLEAGSVDCCVTSPPYWNLRDYKAEGQIGLERTIPAFVHEMVNVFTEVWRVLNPDGSAFINLGDTFITTGGGQHKAKGDSTWNSKRGDFKSGPNNSRQLPAKNISGIPWRVAFALQDWGWLLREEIIWHKPNPKRESAKDRCVRAHEYVFHFQKQRHAHFDWEAIAVPASRWMIKQMEQGYNGQATKLFEETGAEDASKLKKRIIASAKKRAAKNGGRVTAMRTSVWTIPTQPYPGEHTATFPEELARICILAGCRPAGTVLDPFAGTGTTGQVALELGRSAILCELNPTSVELCRQRTNTTVGMAI